MKLQLKKRKIKKLISDDKSFDNALTPNVVGGIKQLSGTNTITQLSGTDTVTQF